MELIKNDIIECSIDKLGIYGEGIARVEGKTVFIPGAISGETVRARIVFARATFCDAKLIEVIAPSPDRVEPRCPVFGKCGGCQLQHVSYALEKKWKQSTVAETLKKVGGLDVEVEELCGADEDGERRYFYRNKASLPIRKGKDGKLTAGFFARGSHRIVEHETCFLQKKEVTLATDAALDFITQKNLAPYDEESGTGLVRHIVVRYLAPLTVVAVVLNSSDAAVLADLGEAITAKTGGKVTVYANFNTKKTNVIFGEKTVRIFGEEALADYHGYKVRVHPEAFFQVNDAVSGKIYRMIADEVTGAKNIVDAYSGAGVMTAMLARSGSKVTGIEINAVATDAAKLLMKENGITNVNAILGDCAVVLPELVKKEKIDALVLDPPRSGCDAKVLDAALRASPKKIIYLSCNPATLARDLKTLVSGGYKPTRIIPFDMFPACSNIETLAILHRE